MSSFISSSDACCGGVFFEVVGEVVRGGVSGVGGAGAWRGGPV